MEEKTGCVRRAMAARKAVSQILADAQQLTSYPDETVSILADRIIRAARELEE